MQLSIIAIGDELLIGQVTDTNSGFIARHISPSGWNVADVHVVPDNADAIISAIDRAFAQSRVVVTTGGLGPTKDDITKEALRTYFGGEMQYRPEVAENIRRVFDRRGLRLNPLTEAQAMVPTSAEVIQNVVGTAPVMWFEDPLRERVLVALPGVPFEMQQMWTDAVFPRLQAKFPSFDTVLHRTLLVDGITESDLATRLADFEQSLPDSLHLAYLPEFGLIRLRLDGTGRDRALLESQMAEASSHLIALLGTNLLHDGDTSVEQLLLQTLIDRHLTVATAESCTGGNIARLITSIAGSSAAMQGGIVSYTNEMKHNALGVKSETLAEHGAVSIPTVIEMAEGARRVAGADIALATSGIAGPGGGSPEKPVGTVCIAVASPWGTVSHCHHFPGTRDRVINRASATAIIKAIRLILANT